MHHRFFPTLSVLLAAAALAVAGCPSSKPPTKTTTSGGSGSTSAGAVAAPKSPITVTTGKWVLKFAKDGTLREAIPETQDQKLAPNDASELRRLKEIPSMAAGGDAEVTLTVDSWTVTLDPAGRLTVVDLGNGGSDADLAALAGLPTIEKLTAANTRNITSQGMKSVAKMPALRTLDVEQTDVNDEGLAELESAPKLEDVSLKKCSVSADGYKHLAKIKSLKRIRAAQTNTDDACLEAIGGMTQLELLDLQDCNRVTEGGLAVLKNFKNLRSLRLWGPPATDTVMSYLVDAKNLRSLSLEQGVVGPDGLAHIRGLANLTELRLYGASNITSDAMEKIAGFTKLVELDLRSTAVGNKGMVHLSGLSSLKELDLSETGVGDKGLADLKSLPNLEDLNLWLSTATDAGLEHIAHMKKLKRLNLDKCKVSDAGLAQLKGLSELEYLHLGNTQVTDAGLEILGELKNLKELVVTFCPGVTDEGVSKLVEKRREIKVTR